MPASSKENKRLERNKRSFDCFNRIGLFNVAVTFFFLNNVTFLLTFINYRCLVFMILILCTLLIIWFIAYDHLNPFFIGLIIMHYQWRPSHRNKKKKHPWVEQFNTFWEFKAVCCRVDSVREGHMLKLNLLFVMVSCGLHLFTLTSRWKCIDDSRRPWNWAGLIVSLFLMHTSTHFSLTLPTCSSSSSQAHVKPTLKAWCHVSQSAALPEAAQLLKIKCFRCLLRERIHVHLFTPLTAYQERRSLLF